MNFKAILQLLIVLCLSVNGFSQYNPESPNDFAVSQCNDKLIFLKVETMPILHGGEDNLVKEINRKVNLDRDKKSKYLTCKVAINCEGQVYDAKIVMNNLGHEKGQEIVDIVKKSCTFSTAKHMGEPVDCYYYFYFFLEKGKLNYYKN